MLMFSNLTILLKVLLIIFVSYIIDNRHSTIVIRKVLQIAIPFTYTCFLVFSFSITFLIFSISVDARFARTVLSLIHYKDKLDSSHFRYVNVNCFVFVCIQHHSSILSGVVPRGSSDPTVDAHACRIKFKHSYFDL